MSTSKHNLSAKLILSGLLILTLALFAACSSSSSETENEEHNMEELEDMEHEEPEQSSGEHSDDSRIPNEGATIRLLAPDDGATFAEGDEIIVEVEVVDFELGVEGSHWHVYIDGASWGMVHGGSTDQALRGIEPGEHKIEVHLAGGDHIELEDGDSITVFVDAVSVE